MITISKNLIIPADQEENRKKLTAATYTHRKNVAGSTGAPFSSAGKSSRNTHATVNSRPARGALKIPATAPARSSTGF